MLRPGKGRIVAGGAGARRAAAHVCAAFSLIFLSKDSRPVIRNMNNWTLSRDAADSAVVQTDSGRTNVPFSGQTDVQEHSVTDTED